MKIKVKVAQKQQISKKIDTDFIRLDAFLKMCDAVKNVVTKVGVPFTQAIDMATINPARHLGVAEEMGSIALGKKANITVLDNEYNVLLTVREGKVIYQK